MTDLETITIPEQSPYAKYDAIVTHLTQGGAVMVVGYGKSTIYDTRHAGDFSYTARDLFVRRGKKKECLTYSAIRFSRMTAPQE